MKLTGIGFANFRSIGEEPVWLDLSKKINILIGANNSGKSNVFRALQFVRDEKRGNRRLNNLDRHQRDDQREMRCYVRATVDSEDPMLERHFKEIEIGIEFSSGKDRVVANPLDEMEFMHFRDVFSEYTRSRFVSMPGREELQKHKDTVALNLAEKLLAQLPSIHVIPDIRKIEGGEQYEVDGRGIIATLASWQIPKLGNEALQDKFRKLNGLLQRLLHNSEVTLEVPQEKDVIVVRRNGLRLPLASYGTGIHELIILAIAIYSQDEVLFCIEEPEIHLHPLLQKEFAQFLVEETNNRYILATHSHALMAPGENSNIVHLWQESGSTRSRTVESTAHSLCVLHDLGISASDLLQANSVIWVEGPSDRIYLNRWLHLLSPDLREGIDYSIMFYGGRLLAHISLDRDSFPDVHDLVPLLRINQHTAIMIDSDKSKASGELNETKQRVRQECKKHNILCWVTDGREIENYIPASPIEDAYVEWTEIRRTVHIGRFGRLEQALKKAYGSDWRSKWSYDKAKAVVARRIAARFEAGHFSDELKKNMERLLAMIRKAL